MTQEEKEIYANIFKLALRISKSPQYSEFAMWVFKAIKEVGNAENEDFTKSWEYLKKYNDIENTDENFQKAIDDLDKQAKELGAFGRRLMNLVLHEIERKNKGGAE